MPDGYLFYDGRGMSASGERYKFCRRASGGQRAGNHYYAVDSLYYEVVDIDHSSQDPPPMEFQKHLWAAGFKYEDPPQDLTQKPPPSEHESKAKGTSQSLDQRDEMSTSSGSSSDSDGDDHIPEPEGSKHGKLKAYVQKVEKDRKETLKRENLEKKRAGKTSASKKPTEKKDPKPPKKSKSVTNKSKSPPKKSKSPPKKASVKTKRKLPKKPESPKELPAKVKRKKKVKVKTMTEVEAAPPKKRRTGNSNSSRRSPANLGWSYHDSTLPGEDFYCRNCTGRIAVMDPFLTHRVRRNEDGDDDDDGELKEFQYHTGFYCLGG
ncbi:expressed unknown protein [Seminavis robusta]|uniref:Uncharacterized protein n=1 Tax=Seminavis robusta TaxID=568900 RepID=A0A9N8ELM8_9STRA|nr:expressed unknown protein [Seminavis robusta]|eukprot:Sro1360_g266030.1 n/a (321) ;mRNA; f:360-1322